MTRRIFPDILAVIVCLGIFLSGAWLFWSDLTKAITPEGQKQIGTIQFKKKSAQRKYSNRVVWEELERSAPLYGFDSIRTQEGAEAILILEGGTEITLGEKTLVTLDYSNDERSIQFLEGNVSAKQEGPEAGGSVTIKSRDSSIEVKSAQVSLAKTRGGNLDIAVDKGKVELSVNGKTSAVNENQTASVDSDKRTVTVETVPVSLTSPSLNGYRITYRDTEPYTFAWTEGTGFASYRLELSNSASFDPLASEEASGARSLTRELAPGTWYARVSGIEASGNARVSRPVKFTLLREAMVSGISPAADTAFSFRSELPLIRYLWESSDIASGYRIDVAKTESMAEIVWTEETSESQIARNRLAEGEWWWRVTPLYAKNISGASEPSKPVRFRIVKITDLAASELALPEDGAKFAERIVSGSGIRFVWKAQEELDESTLFVSSKQDGSDPIIKVDVKSSFYQYRSGLKNGTYYWYVSSRASDGSSAPPSKIRSFEINRTDPVITQTSPTDGESALVNDETPLRLKWDSDTDGQFLLEISPTPEVAKAEIRQELSSYAYNLKSIMPGTWYWRVSLLDGEGKPFGTSGIRSFSVPPELAVPETTSPPDGAKLELVNVPGIDFSWKEVPGAETYRARIFNREGDTIADSGELASPAWKYTVLSKLRKQAYTWEVTASDTKAGVKRRATGVKSSFSVERLVYITPPEPLGPADGATINELDVRREKGISFSWKKDPAAGPTILHVSRNQDFSAPEIEEKTAKAATTVASFTPGQYWWRVTSETDAGETLASAPRYFTVERAPPLDQPKITVPERGSRIDLSKSDSLDFSWAKVRDAESYSLRLINRKTGEDAFALRDVTALKYSFVDFKRLDIGEFTVSLQAFSYTKGGAVDRKSPVQTVDFSIYLSTKIEMPEISIPDVIFSQ